MLHIEEQGADPARRGSARHPAIPVGTTRLTGTLSRIHKDGYGFISTTEGDYYINIASMRDQAAWKEGRIVTFLPGVAKPGKAPPAYDARAVGKGVEIRLPRSPEVP